MRLIFVERDSASRRNESGPVSNFGVVSYSFDDALRRLDRRIVVMVENPTFVFGTPLSASVSSNQREGLLDAERRADTPSTSKKREQDQKEAD